MSSKLKISEAIEKILLPLIFIFIYVLFLKWHYIYVHWFDLIKIVLPLTIIAITSFLSILGKESNTQKNNEYQVFKLVLVAISLLIGILFGFDEKNRSYIQADKISKMHTDGIALGAKTLSSINEFADSTIPKLNAVTNRLEFLDSISTNLLTNQQKIDSLTSISEIDRLRTTIDKINNLYFTYFNFRIGILDTTLWKSTTLQIVESILNDLQSQYNNFYLRSNTQLITRWKEFETFLYGIQGRLLVGFLNTRKEVEDMAELLIANYMCFHSYLEQYQNEYDGGQFINPLNKYEKNRKNSSFTMTKPCWDFNY